MSAVIVGRRVSPSASAIASATCVVRNAPAASAATATAAKSEVGYFLPRLEKYFLGTMYVTYIVV